MIRTALVTTVLTIVCSALSACGSGDLREARIRELIAGSDDIKKHSAAFLAATRIAISEGTCTHDHLAENGTWIKSQSQREEPIYFLNCGARKVYTNVETGDTEGASPHRETEAFVMCQNPVRRQLRSPSTAKFPFISDRAVRVNHTGLGQYSVDGYLDAQNAFGATVRTRWNCQIHYTGTGWRIVRVHLGN
jgi:hypothetical protein